MRRDKKYPNWFNAHFRPLRALESFTVFITKEHDEFKAQSLKKRKLNERKLKRYKKEFDGVEAMLDKHLNKKLSLEGIAEIEAIEKRLKRVARQTDKELEKIQHESTDYEKQIKQDYEFQSLLLSRFSRNLALVTITGLILFTAIAYVLYKVFFPNFGHDVNVEYYSVLAQIMLALLIALYLTGYSKADKDMKEYEDKSVWNKLVSEYRLLGIYAFLQGQIACLVAIGRGWSGTGVMLASLIGVGILTLLVFTKILERNTSTVNK